jgi:ESS family glutamate:Na+ symporter
MDYGPYSLLTDLAYASVLILLGQFLRVKVKFFQNFFMPAGLIAGLIGLALGPSGAGILVLSSKASSYAGLLIIFSFVAMGLKGFEVGGFGKMKENMTRLGGFLCFREIGYMLQYTIPVVFFIYVTPMIWPDLPKEFGFLLGAGWAGGPGTAAAVATTFQQYGWNDAMDLALTIATAGMLFGIFGGIILIKWATRRGITNYIEDAKDLPDEMKTGLIPEGERPVLGEETISTISLDTLSFHIALMCIPAGFGYLLAQKIGSFYNFSLPTFTVCFLISVLFAFGINKAGVRKYVDERILSSISGFAIDYLTFFGIASIKIAVVVKYASPLIFIIVVGAFFITSTLLWLAPKLNRRDWFERAMFVFGFLTGVYATAFILMRIVDPKMKSKTLEDTAICAPLTSPTDILVVTFGPILLANGQYWAFLGPAFLYLIGFSILAYTMGWWFPKLPLVRKD